MLETAAYWFLGIGAAFELIGAIGLLRLPDVYDRAVAATKCVTMGTCMMLLGAALFAASGAKVEVAAIAANQPEGANWALFVKALICAVFVLLTSPVAAHAVLRAAYVSGVKMSKHSVEDAFVQRAEAIRKDLAAVEPQEAVDEKTETP